MIVVAKLIKLRTEDGLCEMLDGVPLGKVYRVNTDTRRWVVMRHITGQLHEREVIDEYPSGKWLYVEMLELGGAP